MYWNRLTQPKWLGSRLLFDVESVERRVLLAGDVMASLSAGGDLTLRGDSEANQIRIGLEGDEVVVASLDSTTINGETEFRFNASELTRNVRVNLAGGDDVVVIGGETHEEPVIEGGAGKSDAGRRGGRTAIDHARECDH